MLRDALVRYICVAGVIYLGSTRSSIPTWSMPTGMVHGIGGIVGAEMLREMSTAVTKKLAQLWGISAELCVSLCDNSVLWRSFSDER